MSKTIRVINNRDRYYNWAYKGQVLEIDSDMLDHYLEVWFSLVEEQKQEKKNIIDDSRSIKELKDILDHNWINYDKKADKAELLELVKTLETSKDEGADNLLEIKKQMIDEAIISAEDLEKMNNEEILELAKNNWII